VAALAALLFAKPCFSVLYAQDTAAMPPLTKFGAARRNLSNTYQFSNDSIHSLREFFWGNRRYLVKIGSISLNNASKFFGDLIAIVDH